MAHRRSKPPWNLPEEKVLLQLFVRGNPFRAGKNTVRTGLSWCNS